MAYNVVFPYHLISAGDLSDAEIAARTDGLARYAISQARVGVPFDLDNLYLALPLSNRINATWGYVYKNQIKAAMNLGDYAAAYEMLNALAVPTENQGAKDALLVKLQGLIG